MKPIAVAFAVLLLASSLAFAQVDSGVTSPAPTPNDNNGVALPDPPTPQTAPATAAAAGDFPPAFLQSGWSWTNPGQNSMEVAYAHKTNLFNGSTNLPIYTYTKVEGRACLFQKVKVGMVAQNCTNYMQGLLFPFYDHLWFKGQVRTTLAVVGTVGATQTPSNFGFAFGADVLAHITLPKKSKRWGLMALTNINKSTVGGVSTSRFETGPTYSFGGFTN